MEKEHQNKTCSHLLGIVSQLNEFHTIPSHNFTTYNYRVYFKEFTSLLPKGINNNMIFLFQKCDTFDRTAKVRTWLAGMTSQDYPVSHD